MAILALFLVPFLPQLREVALACVETRTAVDTGRYGDGGGTKRKKQGLAPVLGLRPFVFTGYVAHLIVQ